MLVDRWRAVGVVQEQAKVPVGPRVVTAGLLRWLWTRAGRASRRSLRMMNDQRFGAPCRPAHCRSGGGQRSRPRARRLPECRRAAGFPGPRRPVPCPTRGRRGPATRRRRPARRRPTSRKASPRAIVQAAEGAKSHKGFLAPGRLAQRLPEPPCLLVEGRALVRKDILVGLDAGDAVEAAELDRKPGVDPDLLLAADLDLPAGDTFRQISRGRNSSTSLGSLSGRLRRHVSISSTTSSRVSSRWSPTLLTWRPHRMRQALTAKWSYL